MNQSGYFLRVALFISLCSLTGCFLVPLVEPDAQARGEKTCSICRGALRYSASQRVGSTSGVASKVSRLTNQLQSAEAVNRAHAAYWLGELGANSQTAVPQLIVALADGDKWVRRASAKALGKIGDRAAVVPLRVAARDKDPFVAESAKRALKGLK